MLVFCRNTCRIQKLKQELSKSFAMKDLGPARQILDMQIVRDRKDKKLVLSQEKYIQKVLRRFSMDKAKVVSTPLAMHFKLSMKQCPSSDDEKEDMKKVLYALAVCSLMYVMVCTRLDISHAVGVVSRFVSNPGREHWNAVKWVMRYLCGTSSLSLCFSTGKPILCGYTDSDMAGDVDTRKSTSGYLVTFAGGAVSWQSRLQKCVALSTTKTELIAIIEAYDLLITGSNLKLIQQVRKDIPHRLGIAFVVQVLSQYMHSPKNTRMEAALRVVRYIKGTTGLGLFMPSNNMKSGTGYIVKLGSALVSWKAKKQNTVSRSSAEAAFRSMATTVAEIIWLK
uniref:Reverse transcriptase Ty1/copia-type domain-containing protein n=1 Tax=Solanum lycopersicum TaxID=4081 RepID=A0A3Q7EB76_SOLLC